MTVRLPPDVERWLLRAKVAIVAFALFGLGACTAALASRALDH